MCTRSFIVLTCNECEHISHVGCACSIALRRSIHSHSHCGGISCYRLDNHRRLIMIHRQNVIFILPSRDKRTMHVFLFHYCLEPLVLVHCFTFSLSLCACSQLTNKKEKYSFAFEWIKPKIRWVLFILLERNTVDITMLSPIDRYIIVHLLEWPWEITIRICGQNHSSKSNII